MYAGNPRHHPDHSAGCGSPPRRRCPAGEPPTRLERADIVFLESTYGDRNHRGFGETVAEFREILEAGIREGGKVLIPAFAVGRTQMLLYILRGFAKQP